ncbi:hypothetical protein HZA56_02235 [Candidatus Poribacteria bacterium]|nr:hypothetical protein [Candidatus Poribacteria bacterium]
MDELLLIKMKNLALGAIPLFMLVILLMAIVYIDRNLRSRLKSGNRKEALVDTAVSAIGVILLILSFLILLLAFPHHHDPPRRLYCAQNIKKIWKATQAYAADHGGLLPPLDETKNNFIMNGNSLYPHYVKDPMLFACTSDAETNPNKNFRLASTANHENSSLGDQHCDCITDMSFCYLGWIVTSQEEAEAFLEAYDKMSPEDYDKDIIVSEGKGNGGGNVIYWLRTNLSQLPADLKLDPSSSAGGMG